ncbi:MAG: YlbF family regulator [Clostridia bacterium]|nr:YlbF family regulator [Clostridia bacterium]
MNIYDTANRLAQELKQSEEYVNYKMAKETLNLKPELKKKIQEFEEARYDAQITAMQTGKNDEEKTKKMQQLYIELIENDDAKRFFETETKFNIVLADVNKIIGDAVKDVL